MNPQSDDVLKKINEQIVKDAIKEEEELSQAFRKGIFFMPELALAYAAGKAIAKALAATYPNESVAWTREERIGPDGPSDLIISGVGWRKLVIEFKVSQGDSDYLADIAKLKRLDPAKYIRVFCALCDVKESDLPIDARIQAVERDSSVKRIGDLTAFRTKHLAYVGNIYCVLGVWAILLT